MKNYSRILHGLEADELRKYARDIDPDRSDAEIELLSREQLIAIIEVGDCEQFAELWESAHDDYGAVMHPDEDDDEFFEHEAPDKD